MATDKVNKKGRLEQIMPMIKVRGSTLHNFTLIVREILDVDQRYGLMLSLLGNYLVQGRTPGHVAQ